MLIYIHGFGSSAKSGKATILRDHFKDRIIALRWIRLNR